MATFFKNLTSALHWNRTSAWMMGAFLLTCGLIVYVWWPLAEEYLSYVDWNGEWWLYIDWLLIGIFGVMSLLLMADADIRVDWLIVFVAFWGGLVIESWGTQTELWVYYTKERPPLWIIPAWPIASLAITRMARGVNWLIRDDLDQRWLNGAYVVSMGVFFALMMPFVWPTIDQSLTIMAIIMCVLIAIDPQDVRMALFVFIAGTGLGYFLELWGTTRLCWIYYTHEFPPVFAVFAHGMAALAFWRVERLLRDVPGWIGDWRDRLGKAAAEAAGD